MSGNLAKWKRIVQANNKNINSISMISQLWLQATKEAQNVILANLIQVHVFQFSKQEHLKWVSSFDL